MFTKNGFIPVSELSMPTAVRNTSRLAFSFSMGHTCSLQVYKTPERQQKHISELDSEIFRIVEPYEAMLDYIRTVPNLSKDPLMAIRILSQIVPDMPVFPTAKHLVSWAGCCTRNDSNAQKVKSTRISRTRSFLKPLLVQLANTFIKSKEHAVFQKRYRRIKARRGHKKRLLLYAVMLLTAIWNILSKLDPYSAKGYLADKLTDHSIVISKSKELKFPIRASTNSANLDIFHSRYRFSLSLGFISYEVLSYILISLVEAWR